MIGQQKTRMKDSVGLITVSMPWEQVSLPWRGPDAGHEVAGEVLEGSRQGTDQYMVCFADLPVLSKQRLGNVLTHFRQNSPNRHDWLTSDHDSSAA
jgi:2-phospho-L-lactate guanylyltransferase (CobY/MobA/RfbA family)